MNPELWQRVVELHERARELPAGERERFVDASGEPDEVREEVLKLLRGGAGAKFLEPPTISGGQSRPERDNAWIGRELGDFELLEEIGHGGMGIVFRARQRSLGREVAVKVLPPTPQERHALRFEKESRAAARLRHPNIVAIHSVGREGDVRFFAMELVDGPDLAKEVKRLSGETSAHPPRLPAFESADYTSVVVRIVEQAADALAFAHEHGVIHRDVKPNNLLIDPLGNVRVVDFGLARDEEQGSATRSAEQAGTPYYMSPEQVRRSLHHVDARTDVYSLGVVLFELLTLRRPFEGATSGEIWHHIVHDEPPRLRSIQSRVPRDLELVCNTAMARELPERYPSAAAFRDDLRRFLRHEAIVARAPSLARRMRKFARRHRLPLLVGASAALALVLGSELAAKYARDRSWSQDAALFERVLGLDDWNSSIDQVVDARKHLLALQASGATLPAELASVAQRFRAKLEQDRHARVERGKALLERGKAGRVDREHFGEFLSAPSERDLAEAMRTLADALAIHWDDPEIAYLADVRRTFPVVSIRLAPETLASAPRAGEAHARLRPIDAVLCTVGEPQELGPQPIAERAVPPGYWRIDVEIPGYGTAELTRYLVASANEHELVARVLPDEVSYAGMQAIPAGRVTFAERPRLGCGSVDDGADFEAFWIDEAELSNREFVAYLAATQARPPSDWLELGYDGDWHSLPLGDVGERWLDLPVVGISVREATACAEWYGKRLPTHVELERVLRGTEMLLEPWDGLARAEDAGRFNIEGPDVQSGLGVAEKFANYVLNVMPVRAEGYRQRPEGLFHTYGNVAEYTESLLVEAQDGMLLTFPWTRLNLGGAWDARLAKQTLASHPYEGVGDAYTRHYIGMRCAKSARN